MQILSSIGNIFKKRDYSFFRNIGTLEPVFFGTDSNSLLENSYEKNIDVYSIIRKIVDTTKSVDWIVEDESGIMQDTSIHQLLYSPNVVKGYTWDDIHEMLLIYLLTTGNSYLVGNTQFNTNLIEEVDVLPSDKVCIKKINNNFFLPDFFYDFNFENKNYTFPKNAIAHTRYFNPSFCNIEESLMGLSPIQVASRAIQTSNDRWEADANLLQNRGAIGMITDKSNRPMLPEEAAKVQSDFDAQNSGVRNFGRIKVTNKDLHFIQMAMSSSDLQLIEKGIINLRALCNVFGIDSSLLNDVENKTFNNRREAEKSLYTNCVIPLSLKISDSLTNLICKNHFPNKRVWMRQDFSKVECLQENKKDNAEIYSMLKERGIISAETAADILGLPKQKT
jgi:HK97 family phage portal protein